jgi:hypothetical protein
MAGKALRTVLARAVVDKEFAKRLAADIDAAVAETGVKLTKSDKKALQEGLSKGARIEFGPAGVEAALDVHYHGA